MRASRLLYHAPSTPEGRAALDAAIAAGRVLERKFDSARQISFKGFRDMVTDADFAADRTARKILTRVFPNYAFLSEEDSAPPPKAEYVWIVDPLDGTSNYARGIPVYSVSIGLVRRGQPLVGVVFDPARRECFFAERGHGAYLNGKRLRASAVAAFSDAIISYELARDPALRRLGLKLFAHFAEQSITARVGGSAALSLCYVAAGRFDTYMQLTLSAWDVAAAILILREAGARVTHLDGRPATLKGGAYLAGAPKIFPEFLKQVKQVISNSP